MQIARAPECEKITGARVTARAWTGEWKKSILIEAFIRTWRIASLETWERSTSIPSLFISRTTFGSFSIKLAPHWPHLLPKLAEPADPWWEVAHLNLCSVCPRGVAPVGEGHVARPHPVQGAHQRQAAPNRVTRLNPNLSLVKVASHTRKNENRPSWQFSLALLPPRCRTRLLPSANRQGSEPQIAG